MLEGKIPGDQVYYAYSTPSTEVVVPIFQGFQYKGFEVLHVTLDRATVAIKIDGTCFKYGVSICSNTDNFNKTKGRELALGRLETGFGQTCFTGTVYESMMTDEDSKREAALKFMMRLINSIEGKMSKYKWRIAEFERSKRTPVLTISDVFEQSLKQGHPEIPKEEKKKGFFERILP